MVCQPLLWVSTPLIWTSWTNHPVAPLRVSLLVGCSSVTWPSVLTSVPAPLVLPLGGTWSALLDLIYPTTSWATTCSALPKTRHSRWDLPVCTLVMHCWLIMPFCLWYAGSWLCPLPRSPPHDYGSLCLGDNWDVECFEQLVRKPVYAGHATLVQHLADFGHCSFYDSPLHDSLRGDFVDRLSDLPVNLGWVDRRCENISASRPAWRSAQVLRSQIQRRWESFSSLPVDSSLLGPLCGFIVPVSALIGLQPPNVRKARNIRISHSTLLVSLPTTPIHY